MKTLPYKKFSQRVRFFIESYFSNYLEKEAKLITSLPLLHLSFEERPKEYPDFIKAEYIPPYKIAYYSKDINWGGVIHDTTHFFQYYIDKEAFEKHRKISKIAAISNYGVYKEDDLEKEAFKAQEEFNKFSILTFSPRYPSAWISVDDQSSLGRGFDSTVEEFFDLEKISVKYSEQESSTYWLYDVNTGKFIRELALKDISSIYKIYPSEVKRAIETNTAIRGFYILDPAKESKKRLRIPNRLERESEIRGVKIIGTDPSTGIDYPFNSVREAERETGINRLSIIHVLKGRQGEAGGWKWRYAEEKLPKIDKSKWVGKEFVLNGTITLRVVNVQKEQELMFILKDINTGKIFKYTKTSLDENIENGRLLESTNKLSWKIMSDEFYNFEDILRKNNIEFYEQNEGFIITHKGYVELYNLTSLPDNVQFNNKGYVYLPSLTSLPNNIQFNNNGYVDLTNLLSLPNNIQFNNNGYVELSNLLSLPNNIQFNNKGSIYLPSLKSLPTNKYEIFKNDGIVYYNYGQNKFDPKQKQTLSWQENEGNSKLDEMFDNYKDQNSRMYQKRIQFYDKTDGSNIFWSSKPAQEKRFEALLSVGDLTDKEILDVGCGYGDLLKYLKEKNININKYVGIDIVPEIIKTARELNPATNFEVRDIQKDPLEKDSFDYVFGSGIFAFQNNEWNSYTIDMLKKMMDISRIAVGVNFLKQSQISRLSWQEGKSFINTFYPKLSWKIMSDEFYNFEDILRKNNIEFYEENEGFIITHKGYVRLSNLKSLPNNIQFHNNGYVYLYSLKSLPDNVQFNNKGYVSLYSLKSLPDNVQFNNEGYVNLPSLKSLPTNKYEIFKNDGIVYYNYGRNKFDPKQKQTLSWQEGISVATLELKYNNPQDVLNLIKQNITTKVVLEDNYLNDDFSVFIYK